MDSAQSWGSSTVLAERRHSGTRHQENSQQIFPGAQLSSAFTKTPFLHSTKNSLTPKPACTRKQRKGEMLMGTEGT